MPYIKKEDREKFKEAALLGMKADSAGELNYIFSMICKGYINKRGLLKYQFFNDLIGALECCKLELYRKQISPYENLKETENGSI